MIVLRGRETNMVERQCSVSALLRAETDVPLLKLHSGEGTGPAPGSIIRPFQASGSHVMDSLFHVYHFYLCAPPPASTRREALSSRAPCFEKTTAKEKVRSRFSRCPACWSFALQTRRLSENLRAPTLCCRLLLCNRRSHINT